MIGKGFIKPFIFQVLRSLIFCFKIILHITYNWETVESSIESGIPQNYNECAVRNCLPAHARAAGRPLCENIEKL